MDFDNNKKDELDFFSEEKNNEDKQNKHHFNNLEKLNDSRNKVVNSFSEKKDNFNNIHTTTNTIADSINLTLDSLTMKNMKFIATTMKVFSVLGIISGVFQIPIFFIGILTIIVSLRFFKSATALEEALFMKDENKLKLYFSEQTKGLKLFIILVIISIILVIIFSVFIFSTLLTAALSYSDYYNSY